MTPAPAFARLLCVGPLARSLAVLILTALGAACSTPAVSTSTTQKKDTVGFVIPGDAGVTPKDEDALTSDPADAGSDAKVAAASIPADAATQDAGPSTCTSDGACEADGKHCDLATGACVVCVAGTSTCLGNAVTTCDEGQTGYGTPLPCKAKESCTVAGKQATCSPWICTPGKACAGTEIVDCSADGLKGAVVSDCAEDGLACVAGSCVALVCDPGKPLCDGKKLKSCSEDGTSSAVVETCPSGTFCGDGACQPQVCVPGTPACSGPSAMTTTLCKPDGSGWTLDGQDCPAIAMVCSAGTCKPLVCQPTSLYCEGSKVMKCADDGLAAGLSLSCGDQEYCAGGACKPQICPPNKPVCDGTKATACDAKGSAFVGPGTDCPGLGKVCFEGACITQVCGNGVQEGAEQCDDGNAVESDACLSTCKKATCGDGVLWTNPAGSEECDDANFDETDGCLSSCLKDCSDRAKKVYIVTEQKVLMRFDVETMKLEVVGTLNCPGAGTPFSMSVDRDANAWVLYNSGSKLFKVSTLDAACQATAFNYSGSAFQVFGMGFSSNAPGSKDETLFIAGGSNFNIASSQANLGSIGLPALNLTSIGKIALVGGPELTGTGNAELWGFFPYVSKIGLINKQNGTVSNMITIPKDMASVQAWAFAAYGGKFYLFFKANFDPSSSIFEVDPGKNNAFKNVLPNTGYTIVGAGVSSCAPTKL